MKQLTLLLLLIIAQVAYGQSLSVFDVDASNFPTMRAKFYAFDAAGNQIKNLSPTDFEIKENGTPRTVKTVTCPNSIPVAVSSVLVFDMSGSMSGGPPRIESAKNAANAWVDGLPAGNSECALVSFDDYSMILHDFTKDRTILKNSIALLNPRGGTNYNQALIDEPSGGLHIAKTGKNKRVLIFLTDGQPNFEPKTQDIIAFAQQYEITIYAVTLDMPAPQCIKDMTKETGGQYFENITTLKEAEETYQKMLQLATSVEPCEIAWESGVSCPIGITNVELEIANMGITDNKSYITPITALAKLEFNPKFVTFQNPQLNIKTEQKVTVTARNADYIFNNISTEVPKGFDINPKSFSLKAGESIELTVSYTPTDSGYNYCKFDIESKPCAAKYYVSGGWRGVKLKTPTLKVTHPNGGESFVVGSDTVITWDGIAEDDLVKLEYSIDNGVTWKYIDTARGLSYKWNKIKRPTSSQCLVRVSQIENTVENSKPLWTTLALGLDAKWSPDGTIIATCGASQVTLLDAVTLDTILIKTHDYVESVCFSPDGSKIASCGLIPNFKIWDIATGAEIFSLNLESGDSRSMSFSPDGTKVALEGNNPMLINILDLSIGKVILTLKGHDHYINSVCFSPDGSIIATGSDDETIKIWDIASGITIKTLKGHSRFTESVCFSPDGTKIASGGGDSTIKIWDVSSGNVIKTLKGHSDIVYSVSFSPDGTQIVSGSRDYSIIIWDEASESIIKTLKGPDASVRSLCFSPDGTKIVSGSNQYGVIIWDVSSGNVIKALKGHSDDIRSVCYSPDASLIASGSYDGTIKLWEVSTGNNIITITEDLVGDKECSFSPDGTKIAFGATLHQVGICDLISGDISTLEESKSTFHTINFSPDGTKIAAGCNDGVIIWDVSTRLIIKTLKQNTGQVQSVSFSPDGSMIATGHKDSTIKIWDITTEKTIKTLKVNSRSQNYVSFSPDGTKIASGGGDSTIKIWDVSTEKIIKIFKGHSKFISEICYSPDGKQIASASGDSTIKIWDITTGNTIKTFIGHSQITTNVSFSPDGTKIASGSRDGTVKLWDLNESFLQSDVSDSLFAIVAPELNTKEIDMKQCLIGAVKDSLVTDFIINSGTYKCRVDSIYFTGADANAFSLVSGIPVYTIEAGKNKATEFRFKPNRVGLHTADIVIITQANTLRQTIKGEGVQPMLKVMNNLIDFGKVRVGTPRDSIQAVTIKNIGSAPLTITGTNHAAPDAVSFSTVSGGGNFTIPADEAHKMHLRFIPSSTDRTSGILQFHYNGAGSPAEILLYGQGVLPEIEVVNSELDFGRILLGKDTTLRQAVTIANIGNGDLKISDVKITNPAFTRISGSSNTVLSAGDTLKYDFTFTPTKLDMDYADLEIYHEEANSPTIVKMKGEAYTIASNASAILEAGNISAYSGDIIELPIILKNQEYLSEANISKIKVDLFFNPTLLYPLDYPLQAINNQIAKITLDNLPANKATGEALVRVKFKAALGNAEGCELTLDKAEPIGGTANINLLPGSFSLLGICHEGGTRLVNPNANIGIQKIAPIPGKDKFTVTAKVTEADTKIRLIALNGKVITEIDCPMNKDKAQDFIIDLSEVAAGIYFIEFKSATFSQMEKVMVEK